MSPNYEHIGRSRGASSNRGFSLTELLVAMVIFLVIMAGVMQLYGGASNLMGQIHQSIGGTELGRSALAVMEKDLRTAFTARDLGQYYQFYGGPEGFMFVGMLPSGQLGRITYVIHRDVGEENSTVYFPTVIMESWPEMADRVRSQAGQRAAKNGADGPGQLQAAEAAEAALAAAYPPLDSPESVVEFTVLVTTYSLVRYEEPGVADLDTFPLPGGLAWPDIDPEQPSWDVYDAGEGPGGVLYDILLSAINPNPANSTLDMRNLIAAASGRLHVIDGDVVEKLVATKRREIWLRMLAGDPSLPGIDFWADKSKGDYVLAERILYRAHLIDPETRNVLDYTGDGAGQLDALMLTGIFRYGDGSRQYRDTFNDNANLEIPGSGAVSYNSYMRDLSGNPMAVLIAFDDTLRKIKESPLADPMMGSPLAPRLPVEVVPSFWIMLERPTVGGSDFRRWFSQSIDVPCAFTRGSL